MKKRLDSMGADLYYAAYIVLFFGLNAALAIFLYNTFNQPYSIPPEVTEMASYAGF